MKQPRILFDLWVSFVGGYAGIPQDARTIFNVLAESDAISLSGLLYLSRCIYPIREPFRSGYDLDSNKILKYLAQEVRLRNPIQKSKRNILMRCIRRLDRLQPFKLLQVYNLLVKNNFGLEKIEQPDPHFFWNEIFSKTLEENAKDVVLNKEFYISDITFRDMQYAAHFNKKRYLNTEKFDYLIIPDVRAVSVSPATKKIIRYHDSFGFLCPDFFPTNHSKFHLNSLEACADDSYFVCNSEHTKDELIAIFPKLESKAFVIPPIVKPYVKIQDQQMLKKICMTRLSKQVYEGANAESVAALFSTPIPFDYILGLSTLEPRKNYINLIRAWEKYNHTALNKIKLIIVANKGWLSEEIEKIMCPHIKNGQIIHLSGVPSDEIPYLFSHAKFFAYLSFIEGFGSPPLEGMPCECPVLASDNATHRWTMGDAALYVDPYDVEDIAEGMKKLLSGPDAENLRFTLATKGSLRVKQYSASVIKEQWLALFDKLNTEG